MRKIFLSGVYVNEKHVEAAWSRIRAGMRLEMAAASVLPASGRINSTTKTAYQNSLISILTLKRHLFSVAYEVSRQGEDWRRVFRGRRSIFWPSLQERAELGLTNYTKHELVLKEPYLGKPVRVSMTLDFEKRKVKEVLVLPLNGHVKRYGKSH